MLKKRKGEIATLLTLGLVILGGVLAIGSSVFLSQQKTTSTRAAGGCGSGNNFTCDSKEGYNKTKCPNPNLEFACCVVDQGRGRCEGDTPYRYRWYGCTGQYCRNTKISTSGGPGHLVACPKEIPSSSVEDCYDKLDPSSGGLSAKPAGAEEPIKTPPRAGCEPTFDKVQCGYLSEKAKRTLTYTVDGEGKKWCCPPGGGAPPPAATNTCDDSNHYCANKVSGRTNEERCRQFGNYIFDSSLSCGSSEKVCCKKSISPPPAGGSVSEGVQPPVEAPPVRTSGEEIPATEVSVVPPAAESTLDVSGGCNSSFCSNDNNIKYSTKCANPSFGGCGGSWYFYKDVENCTGIPLGPFSLEQITETEFCSRTEKNISVDITLKSNNPIDFEPTKPNATFKICFDRKFEEENITAPHCPLQRIFNLRQVDSSGHHITGNFVGNEKNLKFYFIFNPKGWWDSQDTLSGPLEVKDRKITGDFYIN